jgi:hypothetical protein
MTMLYDLTADELAQYHLEWTPASEAWAGSPGEFDDDPPVLMYDRQYVLSSTDYEWLDQAFEEDASKDDIMLYLHQLVDDAEVEAEAQQRWSKRHPIGYGVYRLGGYLIDFGRAMRGWGMRSEDQERKKIMGAFGDES